MSRTSSPPLPGLVTAAAPCSLRRRLGAPGYNAIGAGHAALLQPSRLARVAYSGRCVVAQAAPSGGPAPACDSRKKNANEMLSGVLYWQAQQMQQGGAAAAGAPTSAAGSQHASGATSPATPVQHTSSSAVHHAPGAPPAVPSGHTPSSSSSSSAAMLNGAAARPTGAPPSSGPALERSPPKEVAEALAAYTGAISQHRLVDVHFCLRRRAQMGQRIKVVGSCQQLGQWGLEGAPDLEWSEGDTWRATVQLPAGSVTEYKYVLLDATGSKVVAWQDGNNSLLALRLAEGGVAGGVSVLDDWYAGPGAKLAVGREAPTTRDTRLHAWAGDLYSQLDGQRQELRQARMELAGTQQEAAAARQQASQALARLAQQETTAAAAIEEARALRQKLQQLQAQLAKETEERAAAMAAFAQARSTNEVLQAQLADTTATLQDAIELLSLQSEDQDEEEEQQQEEDGEACEDAEGQAVVHMEEAPVPPKRRSRRRVAHTADVEGGDAEALVELAAAAAEAAAKPAKARRARSSKSSEVEGGEPKAAASAAGRTRKVRSKAVAAVEEAEAVVEEAYEVIEELVAAKAPRTRRPRGKPAA